MTITGPMGRSNQNTSEGEEEKERRKDLSTSRVPMTNTRICDRSEKKDCSERLSNRSYLRQLEKIRRKRKSGTTKQ